MNPETMDEIKGETVEVDGEPWVIFQPLDNFWMGYGGLPQNRGCIVSARSREELIDGIPKARTQHELGGMAIHMEGAIITAFKSVLDHGLKFRLTPPERKAQLEQMKALCAEMWPWLFDVEDKKQPEHVTSGS